MSADPSPARETISIESLRECSTFHSLADPELEEFRVAWRRRELSMGETLFAQGDPAGPAYLVESGRARVVHVDAATGVRSVLGLRVRGDLIGERAFLVGAPRSATIRAADDLVVWELGTEDYERYLERFPELRAGLAAYIEQSGLRTFLKSISELSPLDPERVRSLVGRLERQDVPAGTKIVGEGEPGDAMYFVSEGEARIEVGGTPVRLLGSGGVVGERALLTGEPRSGTVIAATDMVLYRLEAAALEELLSVAPALRRKLGQDLERKLQYRFLQRDFGVEDEARTGRVARPGCSRRLPRARRLPRWVVDSFPVLAYQVVMQRDEMDCGAACLSTVLAAYGVRRPLSRVREAVRMTHEGATLEDLARAAEASGFEVRIASRTLSQLEGVPLPSIAYWNGNHYVVLFGVRGPSVLAGDPAVGLRMLGAEEFVAGWTGILLELQPTDALPRRDFLRSKWGPLWRWLSGTRESLVLWGGMVAAEAFLIVLLVDAVAREMEHRGPGVRGWHSTPLALAAVYGAGCALLRGLRASLLERTWTRWARTGPGEYVDRLVSMPGRFFERMTVSDLLMRSAIVGRLRTWFERTLEPVLLMAILATLIAIHLVARDPILGVAVGLATVAAQFVWWLSGVVARPVERIASLTESEATGELVEALARVRSYRGANLTSWVRERWLRLLDRAWRDSSGSRGRQRAGSVVGSVPILTVAGVLLASPSIGLAFCAEAALLVVLAWKMTSASSEGWRIRHDLDRLVEVLDRPPGEAGPEAPSGVGVGIELRDVSCPPEDPEAGRWLRSISLAVEPGTSLAVVGPEGNGARELLGLLERTRGPARGGLRFLGPGGEPLTAFRTHAVTEEPIVIGASVRENLLAGVPGGSVAPERLSRAIDRTGLREWVRRLPLGESTRVDPVSGRVRIEDLQRLDLARALVVEPDLLLLYRPLSGADRASRAVVLGNVLEDCRGRSTVVLVPREIEEAILADRIAVLLDGRLVGLGTDAELRRTNPVYRSLLFAASSGSGRLG